MSDDYLFDPGAAAAGPDEPVEEIRRLERALARFRLREPGALRLDDAPGVPDGARRRRTRWIAIALAAALVVAAAAIAFVASRETRWALVRGGPAVVSLDDVEGAVRVDSAAGGAGAVRALAPGDRIICDAGARARLRVGGIGWLTMEENTRVRVAEGHGDEDAEGAYRLDLERGTVAAKIYAAPRIFALGTPSGLAVDLGCVYRATVDDHGHTTLAVVSGRVSFESDGRKVYVPSGASCRAWPGFGPGTPAWDDASADVRAAVVRHDEARTRGDEAGARRALEEILTTDDEADTLTLWHLLDVPEPDLRADVFERLRELCPPPRGVTRELCLAADPAALAAWRETLEDDCW